MATHRAEKRRPHVARYGVQADHATGVFPHDTAYSVGVKPPPVAIGNLDGINGLDLAVTNAESHDVSVLLKNGNGTFPTSNNPGHLRASSPSPSASAT